MAARKARDIGERDFNVFVCRREMCMLGLSRCKCSRVFTMLILVREWTLGNIRRAPRVQRSIWAIISKGYQHILDKNIFWGWYYKLNMANIIKSSVARSGYCLFVVSAATIYTLNGIFENWRQGLYWTSFDLGLDPLCISI